MIPGLALWLFTFMFHLYESEILYLHSNVDICDYVYYLWLVNCEFTQNRFGGEMSNAGLLTKTETSDTYFCYLK